MGCSVHDMERNSALIAKVRIWGRVNDEVILLENSALSSGSRLNTSFQVLLIWPVCSEVQAVDFCPVYYRDSGVSDGVQGSNGAQPYTPQEPG